MNNKINNIKKRKSCLNGCKEFGCLLFNDGTQHTRRDSIHKQIQKIKWNDGIELKLKAC